METAVSLALTNLLTPMALFFALGIGAAVIKSDLSIPEAVAKGMALYLMLAIGFKGGAELAAGFDGISLVSTLLAAAALSFLMPVIAFTLLRKTTNLPIVDIAAIAGCYGSISIVTFVAATELLSGQSIKFEGYMVAAAAVMEAPAILTALWLARRNGIAGDGQASALKEAATNGSVVLLVGAFIIGWATGPAGMETVKPFVVDPFKGVLCLFLLDMGLLAGRGLMEAKGALSPRVIVWGLIMPLVGAAVATPIAIILPLTTGGAMLLITLAASASYIAVPAAMRLALPQARAGIYLPLSIGITFPFNLTIGLPLYLAIATTITNGG